MTPLCFVLMPFGVKRDPTGRPDIDFNRIYEQAIAPGVRDAGLDPLRADEEVTAGIIHSAMFERLLLCDYAVADLTTANANVFYELGVRHAARPRTTLMIFASHHPIPFDVNMLRAEVYALGEQNCFGAKEAGALRERIAKRFRELRAIAVKDAKPDSPLPLVEGYLFPDIARLKTDVFRDRVEYSKTKKSELAAVRALGASADAASKLRAVEDSLGPFDGVESGVLIDLFLSYRASKADAAMIDLYARLPETLKRTVLVREQFAFALNREAERQKAPEKRLLRERAVAVLRELIEERGASSETCGLLGRIHKDLWKEAKAEKSPATAGHLKAAVKEYVRGFESDWRDAYPGINAVTLLDIEGSSNARVERDRLLPVVKFAVEQRLRGKSPDYWDHATLIELAVLGRERPRAEIALGDALASVREPWEPESTADNLAMILEAAAERGEDLGWVKAIEAALRGVGKP